MLALPVGLGLGRVAENTALRRRVWELEEERDISRKAAQHFAGETSW